MYLFLVVEAGRCSVSTAQHRQRPPTPPPPPCADVYHWLKGGLACPSYFHLSHPSPISSCLFDPAFFTFRPSVFFVGCSMTGDEKTNFRTCGWRDDVGARQLSQYYSMPICTPARAALMTGRYSIRYGLQYSLINPGAAWGLPLTEKVPKPITRQALERRE